VSSAAVPRADHGRGERPVSEGVPLSRTSFAVSGALAGQAPAALIAADAVGCDGKSTKTGSSNRRANTHRSEFRFAQCCIHH